MSTQKNKKCGNLHVGWKGVGELSSQYFLSIKHNSRNRNIEFKLDMNEIWCLFLEQGCKCALTGINLEFCPQRQRKDGREQTASLDRINNNKGYEISNVRWVHKKINRIRHVCNDELFFKYCKLVAENNRGV